MEQKYNLKSPAVKRLMREAFEMKDATEEYFAQPLEDNLFEWHFTVRGPPETDFDGGVYHGRIILPPEYPMKPPTIILLTMNGRFEINQKICLSISGHHPETWQPSWSIRTVLLAIIGFMPTPGNGNIGSLDYTPQERWALAKKSREWRCPQCGPIAQLLGKAGGQPSTVNHEAKKLATQISFKGESKESNKTADFRAQTFTSPASSDGSSSATPEEANSSAAAAGQRVDTGEGPAPATEAPLGPRQRQRPTNRNVTDRLLPYRSANDNTMTLFLGIALGLAIAVLVVRRFLPD